MVTAYFDVLSSELIHRAGGRGEGFGFKGLIRPTALILNGMLLRVRIRFVRSKMNPKNPRLIDLCSTFMLHPIGQQLGRDEEAKLQRLLERYSEHAISHPELALDDESKDYLRGNLHRVVEYLAPKLREGHLTIYKLRYGKCPLQENGAFVILDVADPDGPVFLYPVFGLKAESRENGFDRWRPGREEPYPPADYNPKRWHLPRGTEWKPPTTSALGASSSANPSLTERGREGQYSKGKKRRVEERIISSVIEMPSID